MASIAYFIDTHLYKVSQWAGGVTLIIYLQAN